MVNFGVCRVVPRSFTTRNLVLRELLEWDMCGTVSWLCPVEDYFISNFGPFGELDLSEVGCENERWMDLAQDHFQLLTLVLTVFTLGFHYRK
jgi:hypothetical protein